MPLKKQEEFCRDEFDRWLKGQYPKTSVSWQDGSEPPDFWLILNSKKYAVEVTRIVDEYDRTVTASLWRIVDNAEKMARDLGVLSGIYVINFFNQIKTFKNWRNMLKEKILEYVRRTSSLQTHPGENLAVKDQVLCHIRKLDPKGATIGCMGPNNGGGWTDDIQRELRKLLQTTICNKLKKLEKINCPKVLILYDLYGFAKGNLFIECVHAINQADQFHTVYVVQDKNLSYVAYQAQPF